MKIKCVHPMVNVNILASTSVPFRPTMVQEPNLALTGPGTQSGENGFVTRGAAALNSKWLLFYRKDLFYVIRAGGVSTRPRPPAAGPSSPAPFPSSPGIQLLPR